jgi:hypothetical protein
MGWSFPYPSTVTTATSSNTVCRNTAASRYPLQFGRNLNASTFKCVLTDAAAGTDTATTAAITWSENEVIPQIVRYSTGASGLLDCCAKETEAAQVAHTRVLEQMIWWGEVCVTDPCIGPAYVLRRRIPDADFAAFKAFVTAKLERPLDMWQQVMQIGDSCWPLTRSTVGYRKVA